jgi:5-methylcytosine-specific restriction protein A
MDEISWPRPGDELSNDDLVRRFAVGNSGGMRKSNCHGVLLLITNRVESLYEDQWQGDVLHYTGMGQTGDQDLAWAQNRTLAESPRTGVAVHLFEVFHAQRYTYQGAVELADAPYRAKQARSFGPYGCSRCGCAQGPRCTGCRPTNLCRCSPTACGAKAAR